MSGLCFFVCVCSKRALLKVHSEMSAHILDFCAMFKSKWTPCSIFFDIPSPSPSRPSLKTIRIKCHYRDKEIEYLILRSALKIWPILFPWLHPKIIFGGGSVKYVISCNIFFIHFTDEEITQRHIHPVAGIWIQPQNGFRTMFRILIMHQERT